MNEIIQIIKEMSTLSTIITTLSLVIIAFFKQEITTYITEYFYDIRMYLNRRYDNDNDPATGQWCTVKEPATGVLSLAYIERYSRPHIFPTKRLVFIWFFFDKYKKYMCCMPFTYKDWRNAPSGRLPIELSKLNFTYPNLDETKPIVVQKKEDKPCVDW